jgi:hypothetical protein
MTSDVEQQALLRRLLVDLAMLLSGVSESRWSAKVKEASEMADIDADEVLSWYGGMGSINDLIIAGVNGHSVEPERERDLNDRLAQLRSEVFETASALGRR